MRTLRPTFIQGWPLLCGPQNERAANIRNRVLWLGHAAIRIARKNFETTEKEITMETNRIIEELNAMAGMDWDPEQKAFYVQRAKDARAVECVRMCDVFTSEQMDFLRMNYHTKQKQCYKNAADLVTFISHPFGSFLFKEPAKYVEGFAYSCGLLPIEHAFVKIGNKYIDPTFERALKLDPRKEMYVSCIELEWQEMVQLQAETGYYGDLYLYAFMKRNNPCMAAKIRAMKAK